MNVLMKWKTVLAASIAGCMALATAVASDKPGVLYTNNFEQAEAGELPDDFLVLDGAFAVREKDGNKFVELPGAPLDTFGLLFGPNEKSAVAVTARVFGTGKGRRFPTFAVGLNGVAGYRLQVSPGKKELELLRRDDVKASVPYEWPSGAWTFLKLQTRQTGDSQWTIEGKAWQQGQAEPKDWTIRFEDDSAAPPGRASIWGSPFSGTPIGYDDLQVARIEE
jgi:hypothetical protein